MTELLRYLPKDNKDRLRILKGYQKMMKSLKSIKHQMVLWNQLIDQPRLLGRDFRVCDVYFCVYCRCETRMA